VRSFAHRTVYLERGSFACRDTEYFVLKRIRLATDRLAASFFGELAPNNGGDEDDSEGRHLESILEVVR
jgi:hypothetical protein